ncbi:putative aminoadipate reductase [Mycena crocata]|nr:putative aminoadipate reductase [Mycena crocata]
MALTKETGMANILLPPLDCSLNLSEIIDFHIAHENRGAMYAFADETGHTMDISQFEFCRAAHRVAHLLRPQRQGPEGQVVVILALTDVLIYQTLVAGCLKAGIVPFMVSHRNSTAAVSHLLRTTGSHRLLTTRGSLADLVDATSADSSNQSSPYALTVEEIPLLGQIYPHLGHETGKDNFLMFPSPVIKTALDDVALYLHSSGSTGLPKCIAETHRNMIHYAALEPCSQIAEVSPRHAVGALPPFHTFGLLTQLISPLTSCGTACIYPPASTATEYVVPAISTPQNAIQNAQRVHATGLTAVPSLILEWQSPEDIAYLKTLNALIYSGGPLPQRIGDLLFSQGVNIVPLYGATEFGAVTLIKRSQADLEAGEWSWFEFSKRVNVRWMPQEDGTFECQFLTVPETHKVAIENLPDVKGYSTKDLFEKHPTKPDLSRIVGRSDDVLIMANGEKTVPGPMEDIMMASPSIMGAIMFGRERNQVGVLIEPNSKYNLDPEDGQQLAKFRNSIWPVVEEANESAPAFARIYKEMILLTQPSRPMLRTPKGTVMKKATIALYKENIEALYDTIEASGNAASEIEPPASWSAQDLEPWLRTHASLLADKDIRGGRDLFDQGFDSLNATFLRHRIVAVLKNAPDSDAKAAALKISQNFVYAHPSIEDLASGITTLVRGDMKISGGGERAVIEEMIAKFSHGLDQPIIPAREASSSGGAVVLLTGSTGGLGSHILEILLGLAGVERVYAFNRRGRTSASERQKNAFIDHALDAALLSSTKLVYLEGDTSTAELGLPVDVRTTLRDSVTVIIHNAWTLDFNRNLSSFEPHVKGTRNLIDLARQSPNASRVRFVFTSSISSAQGWDVGLGPFPEELQLDASVAVGNGYGESKYVSERILAASGLQATSFRIGQISGAATNGAWSTTDWVPAIVKSSIALGGFPSNPSGVAAWLSPEAVAHAIVDVALHPEASPFAINLVHPRPVRWDVVMSSMANIAQLRLVPFADWVQKLQALSTNATAEDMEAIPGIKLLDFFSDANMNGAGNIEFSTLKAQTTSASIKFLKPLKEEDVQQWMSYWRQKEFIA